MKPTMRQRITIKIPIFDSKGKQIYNDYGIAKTESKTDKCRTRENANVQRDELLSIQDANDEIDVLPTFPVVAGAEVTYTTISGKEKKGKVVAYSESTNLTASRVYFRTLIVDAKA